MRKKYQYLLPALLLGTAQVQAEDSWSVAAPTATGSATACLLATPKQAMNDGQGETEVWLEMDKTSLVVKTKASIDTEFKDVGIQVDGKAFIPFDEVQNGTDVVFTKAIADIIQQFIEGQRVTVSMRFWPTWPTTGVKTAPFSLIGFTKAYQQGCLPAAEPTKEGTQ